MANRKRIQVSMPPEMEEEVRDLAQILGWDLSGVLRCAFRKFKEEIKRENKVVLEVKREHAV